MSHLAGLKSNRDFNMIHSLIQKLDRDKILENRKMHDAFSKIRPGDVVKVTFGPTSSKAKRQLFQGVCIVIRKKGHSSSFTLRNYLSGEGLEYTFYPYSTIISDIQTVPQSKSKQYRRAKLYYLRFRTPKESTA